MTDHIYSDRHTTPAAYTTHELASRAPTEDRSVGGLAFIWLAWALAFAFWAFTMSSFFGIFRELAGGAGGVTGPMMLLIAGVAILGAVVLSMARASNRHRRLEPTTEASTAALYDQVERSGGDDQVSRSPEARTPFERDSYRPA